MLVALVPVVLILVADRNGVGLTYDSVVYASTRRVLASDGGWALSPLFPPGLPLVITVVGTGWGLVAVNCSTAAFYVFTTYLLARAVGGSENLSLVAASTVAASVATVSVFSQVLAEPLFLVAVNVALLALVRIRRDPSSRWWILLIVAVNAAGLLRYAAVALVLAVGLTGLMGRTPWRSRIVRSAAVTVTCSLSLIAAAVRNVATGQPPLGPRWPSQFSVAEAVVQVPRAVGAFAVNSPNLSAVARLIVGLVVLLALAVIAHRARPLLRRDAVPLAVWVCVYAAFIVSSELVTFIDPLDYRLLSPVLGPVVVMVALTVGEVVRRQGPAIRLAIFGYLSFLVATTAAWAVVGGTSGALFNRVSAAEWDGVSEMVAVTVPRGAALASNDPAMLVAFTGRDQVAGFPDAGPRPEHAPSWLPVDPVAYARRGDYVVWFGTPPERAGWQPLSATATVTVLKVVATSS